jgi:hypothetical protein
LAQNGDPGGGFTLWDTTNPTAPNAWFLQDPAPPYPATLDTRLFELESVSGAMGTFRTDSSREVFAISGPVTKEGGMRRRRHLTFVVSSSALTSLVLGERRDATIEWEKWKGKVTTIDRALSPSVVQVDGSRVFLLGEPASREGKTGFTVFDFCPGARKEQRSLTYTEQDIALIGPPSLPWPQLWEVSGDTVVLFDVRDLDFVCTRLVLRLTPEICGFPVNTGALHPHRLVYVNLDRHLALFFCPLVAYPRLSICCKIYDLSLLLLL